MVYLESREEPPQKRNTVTSSQQKPTELQSGIQGHKVTHFVKTTNRLRIAAVVDLIRSPRTTRYFGHSILDSANTNDYTTSSSNIIDEHHRRLGSLIQYTHRHKIEEDISISTRACFDRYVNLQKMNMDHVFIKRTLVITSFTESTTRRIA
jgi:hypothetical protein